MPHIYLQVLLVGNMGLYDYRPYVKRIKNDRQIIFVCDKGFKLKIGLFLLPPLLKTFLIFLTVHKKKLSQKKHFLLEYIKKKRFLLMFLYISLWYFSLTSFVSLKLIAFIKSALLLIICIHTKLKCNYFVLNIFVSNIIVFR